MNIECLLISIGIVMVVALTFPLIRFGIHAGILREEVAPSDWMLTPDGLDRASQLGERIFSVRDHDFLSEQIPSLRKQFLRERREIALHWISQRIVVARTIMRIHRTFARASTSLDPVSEIRLSANYYVFLGTTLLAKYVVWLCGPFTAIKLVSWLFSFGNRMRPVSEALFRSIDPVRLREVRDQWVTESRPG